MDVVGVGAAGLPPAGTPERRLIDAADVLLGGSRHLASVPQDHPGRRVAWPSPLRAGLPDLLAELTATEPAPRVVALASGDPLVSGIGTTLIEMLGPDAVRLHPAVSSPALARARLRWPAESCATVTVVGRDLGRLRRDLHPGARLIVLLSGPDDIGGVARLALEEGYGDSALAALAQLGGEDEERRDGTAREWASRPPRGLGDLCLLAIDARLDEASEARAVVPGLDDAAYENDGQLTKRHVRATALAHLAPTPGALLLDLGAGAGSIGIEWARSHPRNRTVSVERDPARAARIARNADALGVGAQLRVVNASVSEALAGADGATREAPDAVFLGGGVRQETLEAAYALLRPGGRIVAHGVTAETETLLVAAYKRWGGDLARIAVETAEPIGSYLGWTPARAVVQWSAVVRPPVAEAPNHPRSENA